MQITKYIYCVGFLTMSAISFATDRFTVGTGNQSKCIIDNQNHLMWMQAPNAHKYSWNAAQNFVKKLKTCGFNDWRLPTKEEQIALQKDAFNVSYAPFAWLNTNGFNNIQTEFYWSSETYINNKKMAWGFYMYSGKVYNELKNHKNYVMPVRNLK